MAALTRRSGSNPNPNCDTGTQRRRKQGNRSSSRFSALLLIESYFFNNIRNITSAWKMHKSAQQDTGLSSFNEQTNTCCFCKHGPTPRLGG